MQSDATASRMHCSTYNCHHGSPPEIAIFSAMGQSTQAIQPRAGVSAHAKKPEPTMHRSREHHTKAWWLVLRVDRFTSTPHLGFPL